MGAAMFCNTESGAVRVRKAKVKGAQITKAAKTAYKNNVYASYQQWSDMSSIDVPDSPFSLEEYPYQVIVLNELDAGFYLVGSPSPIIGKTGNPSCVGSYGAYIAYKLQTTAPTYWVFEKTGSGIFLTGAMWQIQFRQANSPVYSSEDTVPYTTIIFTKTTTSDLGGVVGTWERVNI